MKHIVGAGALVTGAALATAGLLLMTTTAATAQEAATPPASMAGCSDDLPQRATRSQAEFTSDGDRVRGLIYKPLGTPNGAGVVLLHGESGLQDDAPKFDPHAIQMAARGYHVLAPNYYDARPGQRRKTGRDMRTWNRAVADAVRYVGGLEGVDPDRVAVWGFDLGGFLAVDGAVVEDAPAAAAVGLGVGINIWEPSRSRRDVPVLLLHARADPVISTGDMNDLAANLRRRGATVETATIDTDRHILDGPIWCDVFQRTRSFLDAHLLPTSQN